MSILIPGMEMPKNCYECKFGLATFYRLYTQDSKSKANCYSCVLTGKQITSTKRNIHCPLVPVPPHGRLIDADALAAEMKKRQDACAEWRDDIKNGGGCGTELYYRADSFLGAMCETKLTLDKMPTIIPEKEGE